MYFFCDEVDVEIRFFVVFFYSQAISSFNIILVTEIGNDDDGNAYVSFSHFFEYLKAVHFRHDEVEKNEIDIMLFYIGYDLLARMECHSSKTIFFEG